jgi:hypothetical protein
MMFVGLKSIGLTPLGSVPILLTLSPAWHIVSRLITGGKARLLAEKGLRQALLPHP